MALFMFLAFPAEVLTLLPYAAVVDFWEIMPYDGW